MKKYFISSPKFTGEAELVYRDSLEVIDCSKTDMDDTQKEWIYRKAPLSENDLQAAFNSSTVRIVSEDVTINFEDWWKLYSRKLNKERTLKVWDKLSKTDQVNAWIGLIKYNRHLSKEKWKNKADPETFLKNKYWQNEY